MGEAGCVFLALREMRRAVVRFTLLAVAIALLVFLILTQQALQDGLVRSFIGGIRNQSAPVLVYSVDGQRTLQGSIVTPELEQAVLSTDGVSAAARINQGTFTVRVGDRDSSDAAIVGTDDPALGVPDELASGRRPERIRRGEQRMTTPNRDSFGARASLATQAGPVVIYRLDRLAAATGALDSKTGDVLWSQRIGGSIRSQPVAFEIDGRPYLAIGSGGSVQIDGFVTGLDRVPEGGHLFVFTLAD